MSHPFYELADVYHSTWTWDKEHRSEPMNNQPRRYRWPVTDQNRDAWRKRYGSEDGLPKDGYWYGCYFPRKDLNVSEMGQLGTGEPHYPGIEWLDGCWLEGGPMSPVEATLANTEVTDECGGPLEEPRL